MRRVLLGVSVLLVGACAAPTPPGPAPVGPPTAAPTPAPVVVAQASLEPAPAPRPVPSPAPVQLPLNIVVGGRSGADLRVTLTLLLQEHVYLAGSAMDASAHLRQDDLEAAATALDENAITLAEIVGGYKGQAAADAFISSWRSQTSDLVEYASPGADQTAIRADLAARSALISDQVALSGLAAASAQDLLQRQLQGVLAGGDAFVAAQPASAVQALSADAASVDDLARPLAASVAAQHPDQVPAPTDGAEIDLRVSLNRLLQAHLYLTGLAEEAAAAHRGDEGQAFAAGAGDSADALAQQLGVLYGEGLATQVSGDLRAASAALVLAAGGGGRQQAVAQLDGARTDLDGQLADANGLLPKGLVASELRTSDQELLGAADSFLEPDVASGMARVREAARSGQKLADSLATSAVDRFPNRYLVAPAAAPAGVNPHPPSPSPDLRGRG